MLIKYENLTIRNALAADAEQLCEWWNDGNETKAVKLRKQV